MELTIMDLVSTIMNSARPDGVSQDDANGVDFIEEIEFDVLLNSEPDHGALVASLIADDKLAEEGVDKENEYLDEFADVFVGLDELDLSHLVLQSPPSLEKVSPRCPAMHRRSTPMEFWHEGMTTRAASVLASIKTAPDTGDRVLVKRLYKDDVMQSAKVLPFEGKRSKY